MGPRRRFPSNGVIETALAAALAETRLGAEHPAFGFLLQNYAGYLRHIGAKARARKLGARARAILRETQRTNGAGMTIQVADFQRRK